MDRPVSIPNKADIRSKVVSLNNKADIPNNKEVMADSKDSADNRHTVSRVASVDSKASSVDKADTDNPTTTITTNNSTEHRVCAHTHTTTHQHQQKLAQT